MQTLTIPMLAESYLQLKQRAGGGAQLVECLPAYNPHAAYSRHGGSLWG